MDRPPPPPRDSSMTRASVSSSVNGLIQQSFQWLDVDGDADPASGRRDSARPQSALTPPNPAFRSDRSLNLRTAPSSSSLSSSPSASSPLASPSVQQQPQRTVISNSNSSTVTPPSRGASMQSTSSTSSSSHTAGYFPLFPAPPPPASTSTSTSPSPPRQSSLHHRDTATADHRAPLVPVNEYTDPHSRTQSAEQYFYADGGSPAPAGNHQHSLGIGPPPRFALPPSPSIRSPSTGSENTINNNASITDARVASPYRQQQDQYSYSSQQQQQDASLNYATRSGLYDGPNSPRLPPSPHMNDYSPQHTYPHPREISSSSSASAASSSPRSPYNNSVLAAAGIPLPSSPYYNAQYAQLQNHTYPARAASISHSELSSYPQSNPQPYQQQQHQQYGNVAPYPPSRNGSNTYLPDGGNNSHQGSPTHAAFLPAAAVVVGGGGTNTGYTYTQHPNMTESTIWGTNDANDGDFDEKGYYGNINKGMGLEETAAVVDGQQQRKRGGSLSKIGSASAAGSRGNKKKWWIIGGIVVLVIGAAIIGVVVYLTQRNSNDTLKQDSSASDSANNNGNKTTPSDDDGKTNTGSTTRPSKPSSTTTGGDGSTITMENGQTFVYRNQFGGTWSSEPFDDSARAQSWSPALNEPWDYSSMKIYGVNIGGWLHTEPFIAPALYEPFADSANPAIDEWSLSLALGDNLHDTMVEHFETFITEEDFAQIAGAGLNWVRLAIPFWAIEVYPGEPFLEGVCWQYFLKAITWARKYGLRINLDLHTIPGSQNGWNHSGKWGSIGFLNGAMGMANAQRTINYIRVLTEFINQPEYRNVIPMFGIINEAQGNVIGDEVIRAFYLEVYDMMREITGVGEGNGPVISLHDGFSGNLSTWNGYLSGSDRIVMDSHPYLAFDDPNTDPYPVQMMKACDRWGPMFNLSMANVGFTYAGEFSLGINDCGQYLNGVVDGIRYDGTYTAYAGFENVTGSCVPFMDASTWDDDFKAQVLDFALASMDTFQNWFFWTWKIGESTVYNRVATPMWSYSLGLQEGYIPADPRAYHGSCVAMAEKYGLEPPEEVHFDGSLEPWMTGGAGAGQIAPTQIASYSQWPPVSLANIPLVESLDVALLPTYTATATDLILTGSPTPTTRSGAATPVLASPYYTPIAGCTNYLDAWGAAATTPTGIC